MPDMYNILLSASPLDFKDVLLPTFMTWMAIAGCLFEVVLIILICFIFGKIIQTRILFPAEDEKRFISPFKMN